MARGLVVFSRLIRAFLAERSEDSRLKYEGDQFLIALICLSSLRLTRGDIDELSKPESDPYNVAIVKISPVFVFVVSIGIALNSVRENEVMNV